MTSEEYDEYVSKINSEDLYERLQASILLALFPTKETKYDCTKECMADLNQIFSDILKQEIKIV